MKFLVFVAVVIFSSSILAADGKEAKHQVIFGNDLSTSWSGSSSKAKTDDSLGIKDFDLGNGNFSINYAYRVATHLQLGLIYASELDKSEIKRTNGDKIKNEDTSSMIYLFATYNFSENLSESFYLTAMVGKENYEEESKDTGNATTSEVEYDVNVVGLAFGKRFSLKSLLGIENLTYSPSIMFQRGTVGGDLEDAGVESLTKVTLDIVKFDLLF